MNNGVDLKFIERCFELAKRGEGFVSPNPLVGALIVRDGKILSEGYHKKYGGAHAEVNAIHSANEDLSGTTLYCNLEPCCHANKQTPPCVPLIIKSGIKRVVVSNLDPNPFVNGKGIEQLIDVSQNGKYARIEAKYFLMQLFYQFEENYGRADEFARQLVNEFPDNPQFQRYLGRISVRRGDYFSAKNVFEQVFRKCTEGFPGYYLNAQREASYYLGYYYKINDEPDSALTHFKECIDISRKIDKKEVSGFLINAVLYNGMIYDQKGEREKAKEHYNELLKIREYGNSHQLAKKYLEKPYGN